MTRKELIASCRLLGRPIFYSEKRKAHVVHLRKGFGMIITTGERMGESAFTWKTPLWGLEDETPCPYEILLENLINYLENTHD